MKLSEATVESIKEFLRSLLFGEAVILSEVLGIIYTGINQELGTFAGIKWSVALAVFVAQSIFLVKMSLVAALDKWGHEKGLKMPQDLKGLDALKE